MTSKTREEAKAGKRDKPHYYLVGIRSRMFLNTGGTCQWRALEAFESRINWSTWGRSR